jgi:hypothetical protein
MMKEEFEKRIGLTITSDEYEAIEAAYMGMPESVDKDKFVKIWLKGGGVQGLLDKRLFREINLQDQIEHIEKVREVQVMELEREIAAKLKTIAFFRDRLLSLKGMLTDIESP